MDRNTGAGPRRRGPAPAVCPGEDRFARVDPVEAAISWPTGRVRRTTAETPGTSRQALERVVLRALRSGPTFVTFSGGRDSSAVLAVAVHLARREGLPLPVPVTAVFPDVPESDESGWQSLVLGHLGLTERIVLTMHEEQRWLGDDARSSLGRRGLLWPAAVHLDDPLLRQMAGGQLLTGEGGDAVLGPHRITPLSLVLRNRRPPSAVLLSAAAQAAVPAAGRAAAIRALSYLRPPEPWLRGRAAHALAAAKADLVRRPLSWQGETLAMLTTRAIAVFEHNYAQVARDHGITVHHPLRSTEFVAALAREGGFWGFPGRTHLMRALFADLLPDVLLARPTKALFNGTRFGARERAFAREWDGTGVDPRLVDAEALRAEWLSDRPAMTSAVLLHQAWLATHGAPPGARAGHPGRPRPPVSAGVGRR